MTSADTNGATKYDGGKPRMSLLDPYALSEAAKVLTFGEKKYAAHNWRKGFRYSRLLDGVMRHINAFNDGEDLDPESGLSHLAHAMCNLMFLLKNTQTHPELDDRHNSISEADVVPEQVPEISETVESKVYAKYACLEHGGRIPALYRRTVRPPSFHQCDEYQCDRTAIFEDGANDFRIFT